MGKTLNVEQFRIAFSGWTRAAQEEALKSGQIAVYVMQGGGLIGRMYAEQPADAYRDTRAGRARYNGTDSENARNALRVMAEVLGLDPHALPPMPALPGMGVW